MSSILQQSGPCVLSVLIAPKESNKRGSERTGVEVLIVLVELTARQKLMHFAINSFAIDDKRMHPRRRF